MNNLDNNVCEFCAKSLSNLKKVIKCNYCGKFYHEKCWIDNGGCSTLNCNANIEKLKISLNDTTRLSNYNLNDCEQNDSFKSINIVNASFNDLYVGKKATYYSSKFAQMRNNKTAFSWNWAAFLFSPAWIIYRKMYSLGFGLLIVAHLLQILLGDLFVGYSLIVGIYMGLKGNNIYMNKIEKLINDSSSMSKVGQREHINKYGGVSVKALIISLVLSLAIAYIML